MNKERIISRQQACYYLGVREDANQDQIKKAYHLMAKRYHPDANPDMETKEYYIRIQNAYEYLLQNPYPAAEKKMDVMNNRSVNTTATQSRPARIFQTDAQIREQYRRQKLLEEERKRAQKREKEIKHQQMKNVSKPVAHRDVKTQEEEILEKIRAIWLAETVRRQIELDKEKKEAENKRKLYQAFMQHKIQEESE